MLVASGTAINKLCFMVCRQIKKEEPLQGFLLRVGATLWRKWHLLLRKGCHSGTTFKLRLQTIQHTTEFKILVWSVEQKNSSDTNTIKEKISQIALNLSQAIK